MAYALALGVFGGFAGLVFLGVIGRGEKWVVVSNPHWLGGHWWWVAVTGAAGLIVGLLHRLLARENPTWGYCIHSYQTRGYFKMLTARAMTRPRTTREAVASTAIASLAQRESGITSVGLNAVALVKPKYR